MWVRIYERWMKEYCVPAYLRKVGLSELQIRKIFKILTFISVSKATFILEKRLHLKQSLLRQSVIQPLLNTQEEKFFPCFRKL